MNLLELSIYIISFFSSIFFPDIFIPRIQNKMREKLKIEDEKKEWYQLPKYLGWTERALYWLFWFLLQPHFVQFIGVWLALKTAGGYKVWLGSDGEEQFKFHKGRAKFIIFLIGSGLSIISVIIIGYLTSILIKFCT
jgi:hypothetical protein